MNRLTIVFLAVFAFAIASCAPPAQKTEAAADFFTEVKPLLEQNCLACHHSETLLGGMNLESRDTAFRATENGLPIVPGKPESSLIYTKTDVRHGKQEEVMPADGIMLQDKERDLLRRWIEQGATWPEGKEGQLVPLRIEPGTS